MNPFIGPLQIDANCECDEGGLLLGFVHLECGDGMHVVTACDCHAGQLLTDAEARARHDELCGCDWEIQRCRGCDATVAGGEEFCGASCERTYFADVAGDDAHDAMVDDGA